MERRICICVSYAQCTREHLIGNCDISSVSAVEVIPLDCNPHEYSVRVFMIYIRFGVRRADGEKYSWYTC